MKALSQYANLIDAFLDEIEWGGRLHQRKMQILNSLNCSATNALHGLGNSKTIRRNGAYFTEQHLADLAIRPITRSRKVLKFPVYDPTCGAGDLLLRWADALPISTDLLGTVGAWESLLRGCDRFPEFIRVAKRRLILKAISRGARLNDRRPPEIDRLFPGLCAGDARTRPIATTPLTILMNPPFCTVEAPAGCSWATGHVSLAAIILESCIKRVLPGTRIVAILPDVLRSGSRYQRWRAIVANLFKVNRIEPYGRFSARANIDVFILEGVVGIGNINFADWWEDSTPTSNARIGDLFDVSVGAVVPYRNPQRGPFSAFATSRNIPPWQIISDISTRLRFDGTRVKPPFVVVRRTSSPRDSERAIGSIVNCNEPVAVENHLLVLKPKDGSFHTCVQILQSLNNRRTKAWLDQRIRCRHLTVGVVRELAKWEAEQ
jgi:hypothetical protein